MSAVNENPALGSQVAPPGNQTGADPLFEKRVLELQKRERELQKREASIKDHVSWDQIKEMAKKDRKSFFERLEMKDYAPPEEVDPVKAEIAELRAQLENEKKQKQEQEFRQSVLSQLDANKDKYELLHLLENQDEVFQHYGKLTREDGTPYEPLEIADMIESGLYSKLEKARSAKKLSEWFNKVENKQPQNPIQQPPRQSHPLDTKATLNSGDRGSTTGEQIPTNLSRHEAIARAANFLKYNK